MLHGPPGTGKTSTVETIATYTGKPLYAITCGDIGMTVQDVEENLRRHTKRAEDWGCVLLLDEADVFLARRTWDDMNRNAVVSGKLKREKILEQISNYVVNAIH
jgi:SpoVK/Ycf46/Vps4 family AAA+-type ATPase